MLESLENSPFSVWARSESIWGWPFALTLHSLGTAVAIGVIFIINLRLLGLFETIPYRSLNRLFPALWIAFAVQLLSGAALWATKPTRYVADTAFLLKLALVVVGFVLTVYLYGILKREAASWESSGAVSSRAFKFVAPSLLVWCLVVIAGRLTAYLGALYNG